MCIAGPEFAPVSVLMSKKKKKVQKEYAKHFVRQMVLQPGST